jgi:hypothetical protein
MQGRLSGTIAVWVLIVAGWGTQVATAGEPGRLAALAARQGLYDEVCIARAEGKISPQSRQTILADAKAILGPQEYEGFRRALDRIAPPPPPAPPKQAVIKRLPKVAQQKSPTTRPKAVAKALPRLTIPRDVIQPDRVALAGGIR